MSESIEQLIEQRRAFYEVLPYQVVVEERKHGTIVATRLIQAGFDIDVYGDSKGLALPSDDYADYGQAYAILKKVVEAILPNTSESCQVELIPFQTTGFFDAKRRFQLQGMLRIRISHLRGLDQPYGPPEKRALNQIEQQLHAIGLKPRTGSHR
jgi:hypothetical protein